MHKSAFIVMGITLLLMKAHYGVVPEDFGEQKTGSFQNWMESGYRLLIQISHLRRSAVDASICIA